MSNLERAIIMMINTYSYIKDNSDHEGSITVEELWETALGAKLIASLINDKKLLEEVEKLLSNYPGTQGWEKWINTPPISYGHITSIKLGMEDITQLKELSYEVLSTLITYQTTKGDWYK